MPTFAGKPQQNACIESFNGKFRDKFLNEHWFVSLRHDRQVIEAWRHEYRAKEMGEHAQARYRNLFAAETMAANYFGLYGRLLQEAEPRSQVPVAERI